MMNTFLAFGMPGPSELIFIFLIVLLLFGAKRLPELARGLGKSIKEFKRATNEVEEDIKEAMREEETKKQKPSVSSSSNSDDDDKA
ncbi:MAG: twin-arginine translocase TatA/TatE family subunit [Opitutales bacterium]|nr:twin-arginine translocase TatA/TatE family subunit [Opitutales bacterium]